MDSWPYDLIDLSLNIVLYFDYHSMYSTWDEPVTKPLMFSYERHDDSGSWEMKCITRVQLYKYQQLLFCLLLGIISQCILTTSKFMVIKFDKICLKMMLFLHSASLQ